MPFLKGKYCRYECYNERKKRWEKGPSIWQQKRALLHIDISFYILHLHTHIFFSVKWQQKLCRERKKEEFEKSVWLLNQKIFWQINSLSKHKLHKVLYISFPLCFENWNGLTFVDHTSSLQCTTIYRMLTVYYSLTSFEFVCQERKSGGSCASSNIKAVKTREKWRAVSIAVQNLSESLKF